jgi:hypothetical protein
MAASSCDFAAAASSLLALLKPWHFSEVLGFPDGGRRFGFAFGAAFGEERDDLISRAIDIFSLLSLS